MHDNNDSAFLLHSRPYTDSKALVDFFCEKSGVISGIVRLPRNRSKSPVHRQFVPLFLQWYGVNELKTIKSVEQAGQACLLVGEGLYCGLYLNELLLRLSPREEPHPRLYLAYTSTLRQLAGSLSNEESLRLFELTLLEEMGYGFDFGSDIHGNAIIDDTCTRYSFVAERGFSVETDDPSNSHHRFPGRVLKAIGERDFSDREVRVSAKKLCRQQINHLLGGKPLKSRELFIQTKEIP